MIRQQSDWLILFALSVSLRLAAAVFIPHPGYMDAAYSYDIALNLARGAGLSEPFLWNYLDDPAGLPHPSHLYWMPLPTILAWLGMIAFGHTYRAAQVLFVVLSALLPLVSYWVALQITHRRFYGWLAGLLTIFSGYYVLYWGHTDNFTPFALAGSLSLIAAWQATRGGEEQWSRGAGEQGSGGAGEQGSRGAEGQGSRGAEGQGSRGAESLENDRAWRRRAWALAAGGLVGLAHLSRADAPLLLVAIIFSSVKHRGLSPGSSVANPKSIVASFDVCHLIFVISGYLLVMFPWFVRNWGVIGAPLSASGSQTLWLTTYDDLFSYGRELSLPTYLAWGWENILRSKLEALWLNTQTVIAVLGMVFLVPLVVIGGWRLRKHGLYHLVAWYAALLFIAMTFVFTFPGPRGGIFHSGGALLPFIFTAALVGLDVAIEWAATRRRGWDASAAKHVFGVGLIALAVLVSGFVYYRAVAQPTISQTGYTVYGQLVDWLNASGQIEQVVMVADPPGYWYAGGGPCIAVPNEPVETLLAVADRYGARYLVLDSNRPQPLAQLYAGDVSHPRLRTVHSFSHHPARAVILLEIVPSAD